MSGLLETLLSVAHDAADAVGDALIAPDVRDDLGIDTKSTATDMVTVMDRWCEETIVSSILAARPDDGIRGEEGTDRASQTGVVWVIDPIDGTTNFVRDLPGFSVSIAAELDGETVVGVVHDPVRNERFAARRGGGATVNDQPIHVSSPAALNRSVIATGFSYDSDRRAEQAQKLVSVLPAVADVRRFGGAAIDCCSVAAGRLDAYYERGVQDWDVAAGALLIREAGGIVEDRRKDGGPFIAGSPAIFTNLLELLGE